MGVAAKQLVLNTSLRCFSLVTITRRKSTSFEPDRILGLITLSNLLLSFAEDFFAQIVRVRLFSHLAV